MPRLESSPCEHPGSYAHVSQCPTSSLSSDEDTLYDENEALTTDAETSPTDNEKTMRRPLETELSCPEDRSESAGIFRDDKANEDHDEVDRPSNEKLLGIAFVTFMSFAITQLFFAFIAGSQAMKGDSAAMIVDSMTYLCNWIAEHRKNSFEHHSDLTNAASTMNPAQWEKLKQRTFRKMELQMEIIPPLLSVSTLSLVTVIVTYQAAKVLLHGTEQKQPNIRLMMGFSVFNLGLDFLNVFCFARAKHLMGYTTHPSNAMIDEDDEEQHSTMNHHHNERPTNLNMCSAYTHVFADTLRSIAVIVAALIAFLAETVTPVQADSAAAIVVSLMIALSLIPLFRGLLQSWWELKGILGEERAEDMAQEAENGDDPIIS